MSHLYEIKRTHFQPSDHNEELRLKQLIKKLTCITFPTCSHHLHLITCMCYLGDGTLLPMPTNMKLGSCHLHPHLSFAIIFPFFLLIESLLSSKRSGLTEPLQKCSGGMTGTPAGCSRPFHFLAH